MAAIIAITATIGNFNADFTQHGLVTKAHAAGGVVTGPNVEAPDRAWLCRGRHANLLQIRTGLT